jgi:hypothetical protein
MVQRTLSNIAKWIVTKVILVIAFISFVKQLNKTLKNTDLKKENDLKKDKPVLETLSGSSDDSTIEELEKSFESIEELKVNAEDAEEILQKLLDVDWDDDVVNEMAGPSYILSLSKDIEYFYSINRKTFVPVKNNIEVIPVSIDQNDTSNYFVINNEIFNIDPDKVVCIGWN